MLTKRLKVSAVRRRIKRRGSRKLVSHKKLKKYARKTARKTARKVMRGGAEETINIHIKNENEVVTENAVTLKFSEKSDKLNMSIDIEKYTGDVRKLINILFHIDGMILPVSIDSQKFLMGLADHPARVNTKNKVETIAKNSCDKKAFVSKIIKELSDKTLSGSKSCNLEIELKEENGNITFTVKNYDRMKTGDTSCDKTVTTKDYGEDDDDVTQPDPLGPKYGTNKRKVNLFYPKLEFAGSNPVLGINYIDYITGEAKINQKNNNFTFTVKGNTIDNLKSDLKKLQYIRLLSNGHPTTDAIEAQKKHQKEEKYKLRQAELDEEWNKNRAMEKKVEEDNINKLDRTLKNESDKIKEFMSWVNEWKNKNMPQNYNPENTDEVENLRKGINTEFLTKYDKTHQDAITDSLEFCRSRFINKSRQGYQEGLSGKHEKETLGKYYVKTGGQLWENLYKYFDSNKSDEEKDNNKLITLWSTVFPIQSTTQLTTSDYLSDND
jgi:hypothetical protein